MYLYPNYPIKKTENIPYLTLSVPSVGRRSRNIPGPQGAYLAHSWGLRRMYKLISFKKVAFLRIFLQTRDYLGSQVSGGMHLEELNVCMLSEDLEVSWPAVPRWSHSCNLWHHRLSKFTKLHIFLKIYPFLPTLRVTFGHLVTVTFEDPVSGLQTWHCNLFLNS